MAIDTQAQRTSVFKELFLKGKVYGIMTGDSIASAFATHANKSNLLFRIDTGHYLYNQSTGGSDIGNYTGVDDDVWNPFSFVSKSVAGATNSFVIRNADYLLVWGGFNDKNDHIPLGAIDSVDPFTFAGAIRTGVANYQERNPDTKVMFITPNNNPYETPNDLDLNISDYRQHMIDVCADLGIPCFDLYPEAVCGITDANKAEALPDTIHPTAAFHESWAPLFSDFVIENLL